MLFQPREVAFQIRTVRFDGGVGKATFHGDVPHERRQLFACR